MTVVCIFQEPTFANNKIYLLWAVLSKMPNQPKLLHLRECRGFKCRGSEEIFNLGETVQFQTKQNIPHTGDTESLDMYRQQHRYHTNPRTNRNKQKQPETQLNQQTEKEDIKEQKQTENNMNRQKQTKNDKNKQKQTETDINKQKKKKQKRTKSESYGEKRRFKKRERDKKQ